MAEDANLRLCDSMDDVSREFEKLLKRANLSKFIEEVDGWIQAIETCKENILEQSASSTDLLIELERKAEMVLGHLVDDQKELYNGLNKYGKTLEKKYKADLNLVHNPEAFRNKQELVLRAIAMHLIREGHFDIANEFIHQAGVYVPEHLQRDFAEMYSILEAMRNSHLKPAIAWAAARRQELQQRGSHLEFDLHQLQFVQLFVSGNIPGALAYAKSAFGRFQQKYLDKIQRLMCAIVFSDSLESSPYASIFFSNDAWSEVALAFTGEFCSLMGLSAESPLHIAATAGAIALPHILKMSAIMKDKRTEWSTQNELPVEIPLPERYRFHSIFVCPVSREQTTKENPPMMMPCGHIVAKESLARLSKSNSSRFKCPYCPSESVASQAIHCTF